MLNGRLAGWLVAYQLNGILGMKEWLINGSRTCVLNGRLAEMVGKSRRVDVLNGRLAGMVGKIVVEHTCLMVGRMVV